MSSHVNDLEMAKKRDHKIMITDDHSMIREGLKNLLELDGDIEVIAEAVDGEDCLEKLEAVKPDVLLLDINMPKMNGLEVLKNLKARKSKIKVLVNFFTFQTIKTTFHAL